MSTEINNETIIQRRAMEVLPKELDKQLLELMERYNVKAEKLAERHLFAMHAAPTKNYGTYAEDCMQMEREAEGYRTEALKLMGKIEGIRRARACIFGAFGVQTQNLTAEKYPDAVSSYLKRHIEEADGEARIQLFDALKVSPAHPDYAPVRAKAISGCTVSEGLLEVVAEAANLSQNILRIMRAEAALS